MALKFTDLSVQEQNKLKEYVSYDRSKALSSYIKWDKDNNGKNHVINGSKDSVKNHLPIWKKMGYSPKDPKGYDKLVGIFKNVVDSNNVTSRSESFERGKAVGEYINYSLKYADKGVKIIVRIYTNYKTGNVYFSDAWGEIM